MTPFGEQGSCCSLVMERLVINPFSFAISSTLLAILSGVILAVTASPAWSQVTTGLLDQEVDPGDVFDALVSSCAADVVVSR